MVRSRACAGRYGTDPRLVRPSSRDGSGIHDFGRHRLGLWIAGASPAGRARETEGAPQGPPSGRSSLAAARSHRSPPWDRAAAQRAAHGAAWARRPAHRPDRRRSAWPSPSAAWTRNWCVRPVCGRNSTSARPSTTPSSAPVGHRRLAARIGDHPPARPRASIAWRAPARSGRPSPSGTPSSTAR